MGPLLRASVLVGTALLFGCAATAPRAETVAGAPNKTPPPDVDRDGVVDLEDRATSPEPPPPAAPGGVSAQSGQALLPRDLAQEEKRDRQLIVYTAKVTMAVYQVEQGLAAVEKIARDMGGYLSHKRDREITIRVPRARFEAALASVDRLGDVLHRDIQAEDVTDEFVDTEIRIKNARAMQARLRQLLERAPVKEALEIEKELARVTQEIELLEGKLKVLKDKIAYSTITVSFEARGAALQATRVQLPFPWLSELGLANLLRLEESR